MDITRENISAATYKKAQKLFFVKSFPGKFDEIANISSSGKYGNRPNLPGENGKRTALVPILTEMRTTFLLLI